MTSKLFFSSLALQSPDVCQKKISTTPTNHSSKLFLKTMRDFSSSLSRADRLIGIHTALELGLAAGMNALLAPSSLEPSMQRTAVLCAYLALQANKIWKHSLVSQILPSECSRITRWIASPISAVVAIGLSHYTNQSFFEIPCSLAAAYFIGQNALSALHRNPSTATSITHLFNIGGSALSAVNALGFVSLFDIEALKKTLSFPEENKSNILGRLHIDDKKREQESQRKLNEKISERKNRRQIETKNLTKPLSLCNEIQYSVPEEIIKNTLDSLSRLADLQKKLDTQELARTKERAERSKRLKKLGQEWKELLHSLGGGSPLGKCSNINAASLKDLEDFERVTLADLNPSCIEDAKMILTPKGLLFDEGAFEERGCGYIKPIYRKLSLIAAVDKNPERQKKASKASTSLNLAVKTLCNFAKTLGMSMDLSVMSGKKDAQRFRDDFCDE